MFSLLVGWPGAKRELASLSLNHEASQKKLAGAPTPGAAAPPAPIYYCLIFIDVFRELSKHTSYTKGSYEASLTCGKEEKINYK